MNQAQRSPTDLQAYIQTEAIAAQLIGGLGDTPTVPAAASALGVDSDQIVKTLLFLVEQPAEQNMPAIPVVVISHGERRVDKKLLADHFGVGNKRVKLAPASVVLELLGYPAGGVPPFGHREILPVIVDTSVIVAGERFGGIIYAGGGDDRTMMKLTVAELLKQTKPTVMAVS